LQATVDEDPQPAIIGVYGGLSRFLSSVKDVGKDTQYEVLVQYSGGDWGCWWLKQ